MSQMYNRSNDAIGRIIHNPPYYTATADGMIQFFLINLCNESSIEEKYIL